MNEERMTDPPGVVLEFERLQREVDRLKVELAEARKDTERLEWIDRHGIGVRRRGSGQLNIICWHRIGELRAEIDRAVGAL